MNELQAIYEEGFNILQTIQDDIDKIKEKEKLFDISTALFGGILVGAILTVLILGLTGLIK